MNEQKPVVAAITVIAAMSFYVPLFAIGVYKAAAFTYLKLIGG